MSQDFAPSNPFRRSVALRAVAENDSNTGISDDIFGALDNSLRTEGVEKKPSMQVESISIQANSKDLLLVSSPVQQDDADTLDVSSKPESSGLSDGPEADPFDSAPEDNDVETSEILPNTKENRQISDIQPTSIYGAAPPNPFRKSPDSIDDEGRRRPQESEKAIMPQTVVGERPKSAATRASLDVDAFKRLILTGNAAGSIAASSAPNLSTFQAPSRSQAGPAADCGNSTDTSSISRQSIFEPTLDAQADTPRTSHEISPSDEERQRLVQDGSLGSAPKKKPPPPKTRHGKLIKDNTSQSSVTSLSLPPALLDNIEIGTPSSRPQSLRSPSLKSPTDLNKPLPAPPLPTTPESEREDYEDASEPERVPDSPTSVHIQSTLLPRKTPPSPPIARRHSYLVSASRSKNSPNLSIEDPPLPNEEASRRSSLDVSATPATPGIKVPPPPPMRRPLSVVVRSSSAVPTLTTVPSTPPATSTTPSALSLSKPQNSAAPPPPPPARTPSLSSAKRPARRSPKISNAVASSPLQSSTAMSPPPPPPPRQRGSSRSSFDNATIAPPSGRTSEEFRRPSSEIARREHSGSLGRAPGSSDAASIDLGANDILADLTALQREVDELRGRYEKRSGSGNSA